MSLRLRMSGLRAKLSTTWPQLALAVTVTALMATRMGGPVRFAYLLGSLALGWRLQRSDPAAYVGFVLWLWFLTALVRRVADLYASWQDPSMVLLTPYMVTLLSAVPLAAESIRRRDPARQRQAGLGMFGLAAVGAGAGMPLGFVMWPYMALLESLNYVTPLALGWYVASHPEHLHRIERQFIATFGLAALVVGFYGMYQFTVVPPWDASWMMNSEMGSIGKPEPFQIRVFSTMHGPGVLGAFLAVALILWTARPRAWGIPAAGAAGVTLLLSQVRSAWLACLIGVAFVVASLKPAQQLKVGLLALLAFGSMGSLLITPEMREMLDTRIATLETIDEDKSGRARLTGHELALELVTKRPLGLGIGQEDATIESYMSMRDSTLVASIVQFGLVGSLFYFLSLWLVAVHLWRYYRRATSTPGVAMACAGLGLLSMAALGVVSAGPIGICFWMIAGMAVANRHLVRVQAALAIVSRPRAVPARVAPGDPVPA